MRPTIPLLAALALAACARAPAPPAETRPDWRGAAIDGLAPLMTPAEVAAALTRHGYVQVACTSDRKLLPDPLNQPDELPCYRAERRRPMNVSLYFLDLVEGRRLAVVNFRGDYDGDARKAERIAAGLALARRIRARFGRPFMTNDGMGFRTFYWRRPGGTESLPDMISTTVGDQFPSEITMTSMWAYGQVRPAR